MLSLKIWSATIPYLSDPTFFLSHSLRLHFLPLLLMVSFSPLRFTREEERLWLGGVRKNGRAVPINRSVLSTPALVEWNQIEKKELVCVCAGEGWGRWGRGQLRSGPSASERHMTLLPTTVESVCPSAELWLTWAQQRWTRQRRGVEERGRMKRAAKGLTHTHTGWN